MAQAGDVTNRSETSDQQPAQPSSPAGSNSSKEEKNAREKLKKTSIAGLKQHMIDRETTTIDGPAEQLLPDDMADASVISNGVRGRPSKKRSFEDLVKDDAVIGTADELAQPPEPKSGHHKRMRSRDVATGDQMPTYTKVGTEKSKTVHEETDMDAQLSPGGPGVLIDAPSQEEMEQDEATHTTTQSVKSEAPSMTNESSGSKSISAIASNSGFANASTSSPFGQAKPSSKEDESKTSGTVTSPSAFASSGLSAFASTEKSPFGIAASSSKSPSGFGGGQTIGGFGSSKGGFGNSTGFGSTTTSTFGGGASSFGTSKGFGGTFGAPKPFGSTTAFGTGGPGSGGFGTGKPFTSTTEKVEEEEHDNEEDEDPASVAKEDTAQDPRFHEQQVDTGEQGEEVNFSTRARLYFFSKEGGGWKERGTGTFKINVRAPEESTTTEESDTDVEAQAESSGRRKARLLMRADATHRVILNSPVFKGMQFGTPDGAEPYGKMMHLQSLEDGKAVPLQIKIGKEDVLRELYHRLRELEQEA